MTKIGIYKTNSEAKMPTIAYSGTSGAFDLYATETVIIEPGERKTVPNGIKMIIPNGYYMTFHPKSGLYFKQGMRVFEGLVDSGYAGDLSVMCENHGVNPIIINKGDKYVQCRIFEIPKYELFEASDDDFNAYMNDENNLRKDGGFGSSGK